MMLTQIESSRLENLVKPSSTMLLPYVTSSRWESCPPDARTLMPPQFTRTPGFIMLIAQYDLLSLQELSLKLDCPYLFKIMLSASLDMTWNEDMIKGTYPATSADSQPFSTIVVQRRVWCPAQITHFVITLPASRRPTSVVGDRSTIHGLAWRQCSTLVEQIPNKYQ